MGLKRWIPRVDKCPVSPQFEPPSFVCRDIFRPFMTSSFIDEALKVIPNQQLLVNVVSKRVRQLTSGHRPLVDAGPRMGFSDIALKEIVEGKLNFEAAPAPDSQSAE